MTSISSAINMADRISNAPSGRAIDTAISALRNATNRNFPLCVVDNLYWTLDYKGRPCIIVGYGTLDTEKWSCHHHIIKFHMRKVGIFNVLSAMEDYAAKHTRAAGVNVLVWDDNLPGTDPRQNREYLEHRWQEMLFYVTAKFRADEQKMPENKRIAIPYVLPFEQPPAEPIKETKGKSLKSSKSSKSSKANKKAKRIHSLDDDDDDDEGGLQLTQMNKKARHQPDSSEPSPFSRTLAFLDEYGNLDQLGMGQETDTGLTFVRNQIRALKSPEVKVEAEDAHDIIDIDDDDDIEELEIIGARQFYANKTTQANTTVPDQTVADEAVASDTPLPHRSIFGGRPISPANIDSLFMPQ